MSPRRVGSVLEEEPTNPLALFPRSLALCELGEVDEAMDIIKRVVAASGRLAVYLVMLHFILTKAGRLEEADDVFAELKQKAPDHASYGALQDNVAGVAKW